MFVAQFSSTWPCVNMATQYWIKTLSTCLTICLNSFCGNSNQEERVALENRANLTWQLSRAQIQGIDLILQIFNKIFVKVQVLAWTVAWTTVAQEKISCLSLPSTVCHVGAPGKLLIIYFFTIPWCYICCIRFLRWCYQLGLFNVLVFPNL